MIGRWIAFSLVALVPVLPLPSRAVPADTLWQRAVILSEVNDGWMPGTVHERERVYDNGGDLKDSSDRSYRLFLREGVLDVELVAATRNGEDAFKDTAGEIEKRKGDILDEDHAGDPFHPDNQDALLPRRLDRVDVLDGTPCAIFEYEMEKKGRMWSGTAWLDRDSGTPLQTCMRPARFPHKVGKVEFSDLRVTTTFRTDGDGRWVADQTTAEGQFKVKPIPLYTFKGRFEEITTFAEYWRYERGN